MEYLINDLWLGFLTVRLAEMPLTFSSILYAHATTIITPELVPHNSLEDAFPFSKKQLEIVEFITLLYFFFLSRFTIKMLSTILKSPNTSLTFGFSSYSQEQTIKKNYNIQCWRADVGKGTVLNLVLAVQIDASFLKGSLAKCIKLLKNVLTL